MKRKLKYLLPLLIGCLAFAFTACGGDMNDEQTTVSDTEDVSETSGAENDTTAVQTEETTAEETTVFIPGIEMTFDSFSVNDKAVKLSYSVTGDAGKYAVSVSNGQNFDITVPGSGEISLDLTDPANFTFDFSAEGTSLAANIIVKDGLPQLTASSVDLILPLLTNDELAHLVVGNWKVSQGSGGATYPVKRFNIPKTSVADGPCGVRWSSPTVWYPSGSLIASTWDKETVKTIGTDIGEDCISLGIDVILGPGMNIQRSVLGGRNFEYYSEDPYLTGMIASAYTDGVQSTGTGVSAKHYAVNNQETSRGSVSSEVTERALREIYLRGFGYLVRNSDPYTIMSSYNKVNGTYSSVNEDLLSILIDEFGFKGYVMSDWGAGGDPVSRVLNGNHLSMPGEQSQVDAILGALENGTLDRKDAENAVRKILCIVAKGNAFTQKPKGKINRSEQAEDALAAAEQGMVLLKNDGNTLPYSSGPAALFGQASYDTVFGGEGSGSVNISSSSGKTIFDGLKKSALELDLTAAKRLKSIFTQEIEFNDEIKTYITDLSANGGLGIITISRTTSEGADHKAVKGDWLLSDQETELIKTASESYRKNGGKLLVILNTGNPIKVSDWEDYADAILWCGMAGEQVGNAVAAIITGEVNPSGKLTCTWPLDYTPEYIPFFDSFPGSAAYSVYNEDIYVGYRFNSSFNIPVQYEFGYGLSYTQFAYSDFSVSASEYNDPNEKITLTVTVKNTGSTAGREVVQLYMNKPSADGIEQPAKELCGFAKTKLLQPGESETLTITLTKYEFETYVQQNSEWKILAGKYTLYVSSSVGQAKGSLELTVKNDLTVSDVENMCENLSDITILTQSQGFHPQKAADSLTVNATAVANGDENGQYPAQNICDGDKTTRWSGLGAPGDRIVTIDLGTEYDIGSIEIVWESNNANYYQVFASSDGKNFEQIHEENMAIWDTDRISCDDLRARYIRIVVPARASWCSIYEVYVFGK